MVARRPDPFGPSLLASVAFSFVYALGVGWATWKAPDWMLNYFIPADDLAFPLPIVHAVFVLACVLAAVCAHTLTAVLLQRGRTASAWGVLLGGLVLLGVTWGLTLDRYLVVGTYQAWQQGSAVPLPESEIATGFNLLGAVFALAFFIPAVRLYRAGRRLRPA